jgi:hypothetical protein
MIDTYFLGIFISWIIAFFLYFEEEDGNEYTKFWFSISFVWPFYLISLGIKEIIKIFK